MRLVVLATVLVLGCGRPCARREVSADPCVVPTDCPRPANVLVCVDQEDRLRDCITCEAMSCVRYVPEACG